MTRADTTVPPGHPLDPSGRTVLTASDVSRALRRIAHEILEHNKGADDLVLLGIPSRGVELAHRLADLVREVEGTEVPVGSLDITMHRDDLRSPAHPGADAHRRSRRAASTTRSSCSSTTCSTPAAPSGPRSTRSSDLGRPRAVRLAVLVDRGHRELPIRADHVGKNLPTSHSEKVQVRLAGLDGGEDVVRIAGGEAR